MISVTSLYQYVKIQSKLFQQDDINIYKSTFSDFSRCVCTACHPNLTPNQQLHQHFCSTLQIAADSLCSLSLN